MDRETFEQLVSEWLDQPGSDDLRGRIEAAVIQSPALGRVKDDWLRLDRLLRSACPGAEGVGWSRFQQRIAERLDLSQAGSGLDERLRKLTGVEQRVDWARLRERISQSAAGADHEPPVIRFPLRRLGAGLALVGAAAALVFMFTLPTEPPTAASGFARVRVSAAAEVLRSHDRRHGFARVTVSAAPDADGTPKEVRPLPAGSAASQLAEVFLMVEPARLARESAGLLIPFGVN